MTLKYIQLKTPLDLSTTYVKAATLETVMPEPETVCKVSGWGYLAEVIIEFSSYFLGFFALEIHNDLNIIIFVFSGQTSRFERSNVGRIADHKANALPGASDGCDKSPSRNVLRRLRGRPEGRLSG